MPHHGRPRGLRAFRIADDVTTEQILDLLELAGCDPALAVRERPGAAPVLDARIRLPSGEAATIKRSFRGQKLYLWAKESESARL